MDSQEPRLHIYDLRDQGRRGWHVVQGRNPELRWLFIPLRHATHASKADASRWLGCGRNARGLCASGLGLEVLRLSTRGQEEVVVRNNWILVRPDRRVRGRQLGSGLRGRLDTGGHIQSLSDSTELDVQ